MPINVYISMIIAICQNKQISLHILNEQNYEV